MGSVKSFGIGDRVVKDPENWIPSELDSFGAGEGVGEITEITAEPTGPLLARVRWRTVLGWHMWHELMPTPDKEQQP
jgi:hypothetical protein